LVSLFEFLERIESAWKFSLIIILENDLASEHISVFLQNWDAPTVPFIDEYCGGYKDLFPAVRS
jgi:hypothetical protein